uniref:Ig domain-containing protein n=1 Tax=Onchocerca volvulus TaxID=6282 RepID=A0A8R1XRB5_ONCVO
MGANKVANGGRYRYWQKGFDCCLEIFDCDVSDSSDIICTVKSTNCIVSDITVLYVNDDDIAGIEPKFRQNLKFDEINNCLQLSCRVSGYPIPYVTFHFRNRRIINNQRINKQKVSIINYQRKGKFRKYDIYFVYDLKKKEIISLLYIDRRDDWWLLRINNPTVDDEGKYVALARNRIGRIFSSCLVILSDKNLSAYITDV